ncbi:unnamed protein product [Schistocephalus solidus]|uniref:Zinc finger, CCHC-type n=1 Tax=Schistocephalus solidus TaxID=70667 RepID=A0A183TMT1_SCHSO|nr:unnamed protein product [Schistocephalus solidus]
MDDERLPKRLFYGDVATGVRREGGYKRRYKDTLKKSLKQLQINSTTWRRYKDTLKKSLKQLQINSATWETLQGHFEDIAEATANQLCDLGGKVKNDDTRTL